MLSIVSFVSGIQAYRLVGQNKQEDKDFARHSGQQLGLVAVGNVGRLLPSLSFLVLFLRMAGLFTR